MATEGPEALTLQAADRRRKYGRSLEPLHATQAYRRELHPLDRNRITVEKWVLLNHRSGTVVYVTTYNGRAGSNYEAARNTRPLDLFDLARLVRDYQEVPVERCPVAVKDPVAELYEDWQWIGS